VMIQGAAVRSSFAFHEAYYRLYDNTCGKVSMFIPSFFHPAIAASKLLHLLQ
jgi:hypothetical protein